MMATKTTSGPRRLQTEAALKGTLSAALDLEHGELTRFETEDTPAHWSDSFVEQNGPAWESAFRGERLATAKTRTCAPITAILRRHLQKKSSLEEAILELYHGNISVSKADEIAGILWGNKATAALISEYAQKITRRMHSWLQREIPVPQLYVFLQSMAVKQKIGSEKRITTLFAAIGVSGKGTREVLSVMSSAGGEENPWERLITDLKKRGLRGTLLFVGENDSAPNAAVAKHFPKARYQGSVAQLERDVLRKLPVSDMHSVTHAFELIQSCSTRQTAAAGIAELSSKVRRAGKRDAADLLEKAAPIQFNYYHFPKSHWARLRDNGPLRQVLREFREWIRISGPVSDDNALVLMLASRLRYASRHSWVWRCFIPAKQPSSVPANVREAMAS
jgi:putative transposase